MNLLSNSMVVSYDEDKVNNQTIIDTVVKAGYQAALAQKKIIRKKHLPYRQFHLVEQDIKNMKFRLIVSFIFFNTIDVYFYGTYVWCSITQFFDR